MPWGESGGPTAPRTQGQAGLRGRHQHHPAWNQGKTGQKRSDDEPGGPGHRRGAGTGEEEEGEREPQGAGEDWVQQPRAGTEED